MNLDFTNWDQWIRQRLPRHMQPAPNTGQTGTDVAEKLSKAAEDEKTKLAAIALLILMLYKGF